MSVLAGVLVAVLVVTNAVTIAALLRSRREDPLDTSTEDVFVAPRPSAATGRSRRLISIEVLNPIELVGTRGRMASLAGSLAPGIARRVVYDQVLKTLRRELADKQVVADVQLHRLRRQPVPAAPVLVEATSSISGAAEVADVEVVDEVAEIDLDIVEPDVSEDGSDPDQLS